MQPEQLVALAKLVREGTINNNTAKDVFAVMFETGKDAAQIVEEKGLAQISDTGALEALVDELIASSPAEVASYLGGKEGLMGWFVGQVMRQTKGQANAGVLNQLFRVKFDRLRQG